MNVPTALSKITLCLFLALALISCSSSKTVSEDRWDRSGTAASIEISYLRGYNSHRYLVLEEKEDAKVQAYKDQYLMKEMKIPLNKFSKLAEETATIVASLKRNPASKDALPCRTPFMIRLKDNSENRSVAGCRGSTEGAALGKLIKDVEFIMASPEEFKKN